MMSVTIEKVGLPEHKYTLAILNGLYLLSSLPIIFLMVVRRIYLIPFIVCCLCTLLGFSGCCILCRKDSKLLNFYRKILIGVVGLQIFAFIASVLILLSRSYIAELFLQHLIQDYYIDQSTKDIMDTVQINFECCGLNNHKDWSNSLPLSCCGKSIPFCDTSLTKFMGCKENLSMFVLLICWAFMFLSTGNIILHTYCIRCAFELCKEYERVKNKFRFSNRCLSTDSS